MKMAITAGKALALSLATLLTGCGLTQKVTDGTVAVTKSIFYRGENPSPGYSGARRGEQQREGGIAGNGGANLPA